MNPSWVLLDSQASIGMMCNPDLAENIRKHPDGRVMEVCDAGKIQVRHIADMPECGAVWFHREGTAN